MWSTWSFWAAVWACPGCKWQFLPVSFHVSIPFATVLEFHVLQHFLGELTCACFLVFQHWFTWEAATVRVGKCSKILWAECADWISCVNEHKPGNAKRHWWSDNNQTSTSIYHSVFVLILLLSLCFSCTTGIYWDHIKITLPHLIHYRFMHFKQGKKLSYLSSLQSGQNCYFHLQINTVGCYFFTHAFCDQMMVLLGALKSHAPSRSHAIKFLAALNRRWNIIFLDCYWVNEFPICLSPVKLCRLFV